MTSVTELLKAKKQATQDKMMGYKNAYRFKGGTTTVRILPTWRTDGDPTFFHNFGQSFVKDRDGKTLAVVADKLMTYGEDCPIRNLIDTAMSEATTDSERAHYKEMKAKPRVLVNALVLDDKEVDPTVPQVVEFSETQFDTINDQILMNEIAEEFLSLEKGFNLKVNKTGTGFSTKYSFTFDRKPSAVDESKMGEMVDLDSWVRAQFNSADRAANALKSITQEHVSPQALSYSGGADIVDGEYDAVDEGNTDSPFEVENHKVSDDEVDKYFNDED